MFKPVNSGRVTDDVITHNNASFLSGRLGHHYVILNKHENKGWTIKRLNVGSGGSKTKTPGNLERDQAGGGTRPLMADQVKEEKEEDLKRSRSHPKSPTFSLLVLLSAFLAVTNPYQIFNYQECTRPPPPHCTYHLQRKSA